MTTDVMAQLLRERLEQLDMSQAEFGRKAGVSAKHVNRVLNGNATAPMATYDYWAFVLGLRWAIRLVKA